MKRAIIAFHTDEKGEWVAELDCGHGQHVRHQPPFIEKPWVVTEEGRNAMLGKFPDCPLCDRLEIPDGFESYSRTQEFNAESIPASILSKHTTQTGTWGKIHVLEGRLRYIVEKPVGREFLLDKACSGNVSPNIPHRVEPIGEVRFFLEFLRKQRS